MAIQIWTGDQSPYLRFAGAQALAGGLASGIGDIGMALEKRAEENKRVLQAGKAADAFFKALPQDKLPIPVEEWNLLSPRDKASAMVGIIGAQKYQQGQQDVASAIQQQALVAQRLRNLQAEPAFLGEVAKYAPPGQLSPYMSPEDFAKYQLPEGQPEVGLPQLAAAAQTTGYGPGNTLDDILRAARGQRESQNFFSPEQYGVAQPIKTPEGEVIPGAFTTILGPKQAQLGWNPAAALPTQTVTDAAGNQYTVITAPHAAPKVLPGAQDIAKMDRRALLKYELLLHAQKFQMAGQDTSDIDAELARVQGRLQARPGTLGMNRVRVREKSTGRIGYWEGGPVPAGYEEISQ